MLTLQWKLVTHIKFHLFSKKHQSPMKLFDRSYYTHKESLNTYGYGKIVRPKTELSMHLDCIKVLNELNWKMIAHEWSVVPGVNHYGQGDLVFQRHRDFMVIEVKRRNSPKVYKQSRYYASVWKLIHQPQVPCKVYYGIWTAHNQDILGYITTMDEAVSLCYQNFNCDRCKEIDSWISNIN